CVGLFAAGVGTPWLYGLALPLPPFGAIAIALRGQRGLLTPGPEAPYSELSTALSWLLVGSVLAQLLSYGSFLAANILADPSQKHLVGKFITGPFVGQLLFGKDKFILGHRDLGFLALGSGLFILALTLAQGLIALRSYVVAAVAWFVGVVAFVVVCAPGYDLFLRVELG